jgi:hypothetical protein
MSDFIKRANNFLAPPQAHPLTPPQERHRGTVVDPENDHRLKENHNKQNAEEEARQRAAEEDEKKRQEADETRRREQERLRRRQIELTEENRRKFTRAMETPQLVTIFNHPKYGSEIKRICYQNTSVLSALAASRVYLQNVIAKENSDKEAHILMSKVAALLLRKGALNK